MLLFRLCFSGFVLPSGGWRKFDVTELPMASAVFLTSVEGRVLPIVPRTHYRPGVEYTVADCVAAGCYCAFFPVSWWASGSKALVPLRLCLTTPTTTSLFIQVGELLTSPVDYTSSLLLVAAWLFAGCRVSPRSFACLALRAASSRQPAPGRGRSGPGPAAVARVAVAGVPFGVVHNVKVRGILR
jgi:hypothetical protein